VLEEQEGRLAGADREVLLHFLSLLAAERRVRQHNVIAVPLLDVGKVFRQGVRVENIRGLDAVQDHVHDRNHVGERFLFLAVKSVLLKDAVLCGGALGVRCPEVVVGFA
jgi:hypothetical protein